MNEVIIFPGGLHAMGQQDVMDPQLRAALGFAPEACEASRAASAYEVLERLAPTGALERMKGKIMYRVPGSAEHKGHSAGGTGNNILGPKFEALKEECPEEARSSAYLAEIRLFKPEVCVDGLRKKRKSTLSRTMRERCHTLGVDVRKMLFWDDYSEGTFIGGNLSAYDLHVDCIPSSNLGSVFSGHKLLAIWAHGPDTASIMKEHSRELFVPPLSGPQSAALERACCVTLASPGSIYVFSGTNAHAVCNVGLSSALPASPPRPCLCVSSYEAFVGLHTRHVDALLAAVDEASEDDQDIHEFTEEVAEAAACIIDRVKGKDGHLDRATLASVNYVLARSARMQGICDKELLRLAQYDRELTERREKEADAASGAAAGGAPPQPAAADQGADAVAGGDDEDAGGGDADGESDADGKVRKNHRKVRKISKREHASHE